MSIRNSRPSRRQHLQRIGHKSLLSLWVLLLVAVWMGEATVFAAHLSRKIPPRERGAAPILSPLLPPVGGPTPPEEVPAVMPQGVLMPEAIHPVSFTEADAPKANSPSPAPKKIQPAVTSPKAQPAASVSQGHPVVISPVPLLPMSEVEAQKPVPAASESPKSTVSQKQQAPRSKKTHETVRGSVVVQVDAQETPTLRPTLQDPVPPASKPSTQTANRKQEAAVKPQPAIKKSKKKPTVEFPEGVLPATADGKSQRARAASNKTTERHIYPAGYRPYVPVLTDLTRVRLKTALQHYERAIYYGQQRRYDEAIAEYTEALEQHPTFADAYVGLSSVAMPKQDWESVMEYARQALSLKQGFMEPSNITRARFNLGIASCVANDYGQAKKYYKLVKKAQRPAADQLHTYMEKHCRP